MYMKRVALIAAAVLATAALAACGNHNQPQPVAAVAVPQQQVVQAAPQPQVVEQAPQQVVQAAPVVVQQPPQVVVAPAPIVVVHHSYGYVPPVVVVHRSYAPAVVVRRTVVVHHYH
jgi:hypothetical protein